MEPRYKFYSFIIYLAGQGLHCETTRTMKKINTKPYARRHFHLNNKTLSMLPPFTPRLTKTRRRESKHCYSHLLT